MVFPEPGNAVMEQVSVSFTIPHITQVGYQLQSVQGVFFPGLHNTWLISFSFSALRSGVWSQLRLIRHPGLEAQDSMNELCLSITYLSLKS